MAMTKISSINIIMSDSATLRTYGENALCNGMWKVVTSLMDEVRDKNIPPNMYLRELQNAARSLAMSDEQTLVQTMRDSVYQYDSWSTLCLVNVDDVDADTIMSKLVKASCRTVWNKIDLFKDTRKNYAKIMATFLDDVSMHTQSLFTLPPAIIGGTVMLNDLDVDESDEETEFEGVPATSDATARKPVQEDVIEDFADLVAPVMMTSATMKTDAVAEASDVVIPAMTSTDTVIEASDIAVPTMTLTTIETDAEPSQETTDFEMGAVTDTTEVAAISTSSSPLHVPEQKPAGHHQTRRNSFLKKLYEHTLRQQQARKKNLKGSSMLKTNSEIHNGSEE